MGHGSEETGHRWNKSVTGHKVWVERTVSAFKISSQFVLKGSLCQMGGAENLKIYWVGLRCHGKGHLSHIFGKLITCEK